MALSPKQIIGLAVGFNSLIALTAGVYIYLALTQPQKNKTPTPKTNQPTQSLQITSDAFAPNEKIPATYTCAGENINPPLRIKNIPPAAKTLALTVIDTDAPNGSFIHWVVWNISPTQSTIAENAVPDKATVGKNSAGSNKYIGPCPPTGTHHYHFTVYALDQALANQSSWDANALKEAIKNHIVGEGELTGVFSK